MENMNDGFEQENGLQEKLERIVAEETETIRAQVAEEALGYGGIKIFFKDLMMNGCISGFVSSLVLYRDTYEFFDKHYAEIEYLRNEWETAVGQPIQVKGDMKNFWAWFAFEETARRMADELKIQL